MHALSDRAGLVGRREQIGLVEQAAGRARAGQPQLVVFGGEAGIGKTRLLEHAATGLADMRVLRGECVELGTEGLPLAPLTSMLRDLIQQVGVDRLLPLLPDADLVLALLPELRLPARASGGQARVFELFAALLQRLGEEQPVLLVIDDLHWADRSTRELLGFLTRTLRGARVLVLAAYRSDAVPPGAPVLAFLAELERLPGVRRVELGRLGRAEAEQMIRGLLPDPPAELVDRVFRRSGGNPFFIEELLRAGTQRLPESLRDLLLDRIARLPEPTRRVVQVAAIGGPSVPHLLLAAVSGMAEPALLPALRAAVDARVMTTSGVDGYRFRHGLLQEAVLEDLLPAERVRLHDSYARALTARPGLVPPERFAAAVAYHWYGAGELARALSAALEAADVAEAMHAHAEQSQLLVRALDSCPPGAEPGFDRIRTWEKAVAAALWAGEVREGLRLVERALAEVEEPAAMLLALRSLAKHDLAHADALAAADDALKAVPDAPPLVRARALDLLSAVLMMRLRSAQAVELGTEAIRLGAELGEPDLEMNAKITVATALGQLGDLNEALAMLYAALEVAERRGDRIRMARVYNNLAHLLLMAGRVPEAIETARTGTAVAGKAGLARTVGAIITLNLAGALVTAGRWDEADTALVEGLAADPPGPLAAAMHGVRGRIALCRGDLAGATDEASHAQALSPGGPEAVSVRHIVAEVALAEGRLADARAAVDAGLVMFPDCDDAGARWLLLVSGARVEALARLRERTLGEPADPDRVATLRATAATISVDTPLTAAYAAGFAAELGEIPWSEVVAAWDAVGAPFPAGQARLRAAETALAAGERTAAEAWLREAKDQARAVGAGPLLAEIQKLARGAGAALEETPDHDVSDARRLGLTEREVEVLRLLVAGRSNREIATTLYISPKTASVHVSHILAKLGVANRVEATAAAYRLRLVN